MLGTTIYGGEMTVTPQLVTIILAIDARCTRPIFTADYIHKNLGNLELQKKYEIVKERDRPFQKETVFRE